MKYDLPQDIADIFQQSQVSLSLSDPNLPDDPIVFVNDAFCRLTGYDLKEISGQNCRLLQRNTWQPDFRAEMIQSFRTETDARAIVRNFRKNGEPFDNLLHTFHVFSDSGKLLYRIGSQFEIPMMHKVAALEAHTTDMLDSVEKIRGQIGSPANAMLRVSEAYGLAVQDLLQNRLFTLRSHRSL